MEGDVVRGRLSICTVRFAFSTMPIATQAKGRFRRTLCGSPVSARRPNFRVRRDFPLVHGSDRPVCRDPGLASDSPSGHSPEVDRGIGFQPVISQNKRQAGSLSRETEFSTHGTRVMYTGAIPAVGKLWGSNRAVLPGGSIAEGSRTGQWNRLPACQVQPTTGWKPIPRSPVSINVSRMGHKSESRVATTRPGDRWSNCCVVSS